MNGPSIPAGANAAPLDGGDRRAIKVEDLCPICGEPMDYVCGPDGNSGGMYCWPCEDAVRDTTTDRDGRVYEFPIPGDVNYPKPPATTPEFAADSGGIMF